MPFVFLGFVTSDKVIVTCDENSPDVYTKAPLTVIYLLSKSIVHLSTKTWFVVTMHLVSGLRVIKAG